MKPYSKLYIFTAVFLLCLLQLTASAREGNAVFVASDFEGTDFVAETAGMSLTHKNNEASLVYDNSTASQCLYLNKTQTNDMHFDIEITADISYLAYETDLKLTEFGATVYPIIIFDETSGNRLEDYPLTINKDGQLILRDGTLIYTLKADEWINLKFLYNFPKRTFNVYINGNPVKENVKFHNTNKKLITATDLRIWIYSPDKNAKLYFDNLNIYESSSFKDNFSEDAKSIFWSENDLLPYLSDICMYNQYSGSVYNGQKAIGVEKSDDSTDVCYVTPDVITALFGEYNGTEDKINLVQYAENIGKHILSNEHGLYLFSDAEIGLNDMIVEKLNSYMLFDHPDAEKIKSDFYKKISETYQHPRIIADANTFSEIKKRLNSDSRLKEWHNEVIEKADEYLSYDVVKYVIKDSSILDVSREVMNKMTYWGYAYQTTGNTKYSDRAWQELETVCAFSDWHPHHYLDAAEMMYGVAIAYDWMYHAFEPWQHEIIEKALIEKGVKVAWNAYHGRLLVNGLMGAAAGFATDKNNFNIVGAAGAITAALAVVENDPDLCFDTVANAIQSVENGISLYFPDGGWEEGSGYWVYSAQYLSRMLAAMDTTLGSHYGITNAPGLRKTPYYAIGLDSFVSVNNFHDAWPGHINSPEYSYFAKLNNDSALFNRRALMIDDGWKGISPSVYDIIWYGGANTNSKINLPLDIHTRNTDTFTIRGGWNKSDSLYLSGHGGKTNTYHSHMDAGSFVFDIMGERWAHDLRPEDYGAERGYSIGRSYRRRAEAHNCVVINPKTCGEYDMNWNSTTYVDMVSKDSGAYVIQDLTEAYSDGISSGIVYNSSASKYLRGFYVGDNRRSLTVRDEIELTKDSELYWFMNITADDVYINGKEIILTQNSKKLKLQFDTTASDFEVYIKPGGTLTPEHYLVPEYYYDGQSALDENQGQLVIKTNAAKGSYVFEAKMAPANESAAQSGLMNIPISEWTIPEGDYVEPADTDITGYNYKTETDEPYIFLNPTEFHIQKRVYGVKGKSETDESYKYSALRVPSGNGGFKYTQQRWNINADLSNSDYFRFTAEFAFDGVSMRRWVNFSLKGDTGNQDPTSPIDFLSDNKGHQIIRVNGTEKDIDIPLGKWVRLDIVLDRKNKVFDIYIDGKMIADDEVLKLKKDMDIIGVSQVLLGLNQLWNSEKSCYYPNDTYIDGVDFTTYNSYPDIPSYTSPSVSGCKDTVKYLSANESVQTVHSINAELFDGAYYLYSNVLSAKNAVSYSYSARFTDNITELCNIQNGTLYIGDMMITDNLPDNDFKLSFLINTHTLTYDIYINSQKAMSDIPLDITDSRIHTLNDIILDIEAHSDAYITAYNADFGVFTDEPQISEVDLSCLLPDITFFKNGDETSNCSDADSITANFTSTPSYVTVLAAYGNGKLIRLTTGTDTLTLDEIGSANVIKLFRFESLDSLIPYADAIILRNKKPSLVSGLSGIGDENTVNISFDEISNH